MTPYTPKDLAENWEFKILRSASGGFRNPDWLRSVLEEEARAGWTLVEKFDDSRLRLKRPASARARDDALEFDARRTWVGIGPTKFTLLILLIALAGTVALSIVVYLILSGTR